MRRSGSGRPSSRLPWPRTCAGAGAARWAAVGTSMRRRYCRRIRRAAREGTVVEARSGTILLLAALMPLCHPAFAQGPSPPNQVQRIRRQYLRFIDMPTAAHLAAPAPPQLFGQGGRELGFPLPDGLMAEHDAAHGKHLGQVAQAQLIAQTPERHERDDVGRVLRPVQESVRALIELLAARAAAEPAVALGGCARVAPSQLPIRMPSTASASTPL